MIYVRRWHAIMEADVRNPLPAAVKGVVADAARSGSSFSADASSTGPARWLTASVRRGDLHKVIRAMRVQAVTALPSSRRILPLIRK